MVPVTFKVTVADGVCAGAEGLGAVHRAHQRAVLQPGLQEHADVAERVADAGACSKPLTGSAVLALALRPILLRSGPQED